MRERASLTAIVERALELTRFEAVMLGLPKGLQRAANVRKLMETAREFETHRFFGLGDFVRHLRRLVQEAPREPQAQIAGETENVVRLMTIHQAKGLEFPVAIVADLGRRPHSDYESIVMTPDDGLLVCDTVGAGDDRLPNPLLDGLSRRGQGPGTGRGRAGVVRRDDAGARSTDAERGRHERRMGQAHTRGSWASSESKISLARRMPKRSSSDGVSDCPPARRRTRARG